MQSLSAGESYSGQGIGWCGAGSTGNRAGWGGMYGMVGCGVGLRRVKVDRVVCRYV